MGIFDRFLQAHASYRLALPHKCSTMFIINPQTLTYLRTTQSEKKQYKADSEYTNCRCSVPNSVCAQKPKLCNNGPQSHIYTPKHFCIFRAIPELYAHDVYTSGELEYFTISRACTAMHMHIASLLSNSIS